jgi:DNA-binding NarL/FixJ family response regulator
MVPARIRIFSSNALFRECLAAVLEANARFAVAGHGDDFPSTLPELRAEAADLVLVDTQGSRAAAFELVRRLTRESPAPILLLGLVGTRTDALQCMESGAKGYVVAGASLEDLYGSIEGVLRGEVAYTPEATAAMFERLAELSGEQYRDARFGDLNLTSRELEILTLAGRGLTNPEIAQRLVLSIHTIKNHLHHVFKKLKVSTRIQAVQLGLRQGWLESLRLSPGSEDLTTRSFLRR